MTFSLPSRDAFVACLPALSLQQTSSTDHGFKSIIPNNLGAIMQQAAQSNDVFTLTKACPRSGSLAFQVKDGNGKPFYLQSSGREMKTQPDDEPACIVTQQSLLPPDPAQLRAFAPGEVQSDLMTMLSGILSDKQTDALGAVSLFVWLSFLHPMFEELPTLWLYTPDLPFQQTVKDHLGRLCFNAVQVKHYYSLSATLLATERHSSTLIFSDPSKYPSAFRKAFFGDRNRRENIYPSTDNVGMRMFGLRIVISDKGPDEESKPYCVTVPLRPLEKFIPFNETLVLQLRTGILNKAIHYQPSQSMQQEWNPPNAKLGMAFQSLFQVLSFLKDIGEVDKSFEERVSPPLIQRVNEGNRKQSNPSTLDFLHALKEFLSNPSQLPLLKEWYPLEQIAAFLHSSYEVFHGINAKALSQELNKWPNLIRERKRITVRDASGTKQVTCVLLDNEALNNHLN
jgi:hypothetical protein